MDNAYGPMWNKANRGNYRVVRCRQCVDWYETPGAAPVKAHTLASKHAKKFGHVTFVIDLVLLAVEYQYEFTTLFDGDDAPF